MPTVKCANCGKEIERTNYQINNSNYSLCSKKCCSEYLSNKIEIVCDNCGKTFKRIPAKVKRNTNNYCCKQCEAEARTGVPDWSKRKAEPVECDWCGTLIYKSPYYLKEAEHHFCSNICQGHWVSANRTKENNPSYQGGKQTVQCDNCGKDVEKWPFQVRQSKHLFCDTNCKVEFIRGQYAPNWRGGISNSPYPEEWTRTLREQIRDRDNRQCQLCFEYEDVLSKKLHVHHIDGNKNNCSKDNLISLCIVCHIKVERSKDYNIYEQIFEKQVSRL